ncbi:MAG: hypothetical protein LC122_03185 [Chitinophagales bacterium]|nr:hypothetical protein [Chitinophagales bacterium]
MIYIENKKKKIENIKKKYPCAEIIDLTSTSDSVFVRFSPFYPTGDIPIPFSAPETGDSVEGIWQGLKVFQNKGTDFSKFKIQNMKGIKRSIRVNGPIIGHQKGMFSNDILDYLPARESIFITSYYWVLDNKLQDLLTVLINKSKEKDLVFLDYNVNEDVLSLKKPLSHAALVKKYIETTSNLYSAPVQGSLDF